MEACILQCGNPCSKTDSIDKISLSKWNNIKTQCQKWIGLDTFELVYTSIDWELGPTGFFMHDRCYLKLCSGRKLLQAENRKQKQSQNLESEDQSSGNSPTVINESMLSLPTKCTHSAGVVHDKTKCIWCFKGPAKKHPNRYISFLHSVHGLLLNVIPFY